MVESIFVDPINSYLNKQEITNAFNEAIKKPSQGVCFFWWNHVIEKNKTFIVSHLFNKHRV